MFFLFSSSVVGLGVVVVTISCASACFGAASPSRLRARRSGGRCCAVSAPRTFWTRVVRLVIVIVLDRGARHRIRDANDCFGRDCPYGEAGVRSGDPQISLKQVVYLAEVVYHVDLGGELINTSTFSRRAIPNTGQQGAKETFGAEGSVVVVSAPW